MVGTAPGLLLDVMVRGALELTFEIRDPLPRLTRVPSTVVGCMHGPLIVPVHYMRCDRACAGRSMHGMITHVHDLRGQECTGFRPR